MPELEASRSTTTMASSSMAARGISHHFFSSLRNINSSSLPSGVNTLIDRPKKALHREVRIHVSTSSGLDFSFPIKGDPRLEGQPAGLLSNIEVSPFGLHWPDLDEDLSI